MALKRRRGKDNPGAAYWYPNAIRPIRAVVGSLTRFAALSVTPSFFVGLAGELWLVLPTIDFHKIFLDKTIFKF